MDVQGPCWPLFWKYGHARRAPPVCVSLRAVLGPPPASPASRQSLAFAFPSQISFITQIYFFNGVIFHGADLVTSPAFLPFSSLGLIRVYG